MWSSFSFMKYKIKDHILTLNYRLNTIWKWLISFCQIRFIKVGFHEDFKTGVTHCMGGVVSHNILYTSKILVLLQKKVEQFRAYFFQKQCSYIFDKRLDKYYQWNGPILLITPGSPTIVYRQTEPVHTQRIPTCCTLITPSKRQCVVVLISIRPPLMWNHSTAVHTHTRPHAHTHTHTRASVHVIL